VQLRRRSLAAEGGFTLPELMISIVVGTLVIIAAYGLLDASRSGALKVTDRVDATQRGRLAMDEIVRELRSQVCLDPAAGAIADGRDNSVTFYTFSGTGTYAPERHTITWDAQAHTISDYRYAGTGVAPKMTYPASPTSTRVLLTDVIQDGAAPVFSYYGWSADGTVTPSVRLATPLNSADALRAVRIVVQFRTLPARPGKSAESTALQDEVFSRTADPNGADGPTPTQCT
jgi:prepilin-type N-terminal cleavage/methylation domain-containing protein